MPFILRKTITETFLERVKTTPHLAGFKVKQSDGIWKPVTFKEFYDECETLSHGLMHLGLTEGDKAVILSTTRIEWSLSDMAILGARAVTVPVYPSNTAPDVAYILNHCEAKVVIVEDQKQLEKVLLESENLPYLQKIIAIDHTALVVASQRKEVLTFQALKELGRRHQKQNPTRFNDNLANARPDDLITICYTSGTTGIPKGAMLTHDNMMSVLEDVVAVIRDHIKPDKEVLVTFLPFSHIIGKVESMAVHTFGWCECFAENMDRLIENMGEVKPTILFAVPRIFEKGFNRIQTMIDEAPAAKKKLFSWALEVGKRYYSAVWKHSRPAPKDWAQYQVAKQLVFSKVSARFGGRLKFAVCGGAPLPKDIGEFFQIAGIGILEGYGLTETCAPVTLNVPDDIRFGVVGRPLTDVSIKFADDGEIMVKSRKVFKGYYKMPHETEDALSGGWFKTGDIGHLDSDGFLHITDRKKDIIVTSGGKNVAPQKIENLAKAHQFIGQFVVFGDRKPYLTALVSLDREPLLQYANENQILYSEFAGLIKHPKIHSLVQKIVDDVNSKLASFETIKRFHLIAHEFTVEGGELTPSLKVKRNIIAKRFVSEIDQMYRA